MLRLHADLAHRILTRAVVLAVLGAVDGQIARVQFRQHCLDLREEPVPRHLFLFVCSFSSEHFIGHVPQYTAEWK